MKKPIIFLFVVILLVKTTSAHEGGHYHSGDGTIFNSWTLKNGQQILGNFMYSKGNQMFVEANEGKMIAIKMNDLMPADKKLAAFKVAQLEKMNQQYEPSASSSFFNFEKFISLVIWFTIALALLSSVVKYLNIELVKRNKFQFLIGYASVILIVACSKSGTSAGTVTQPTIVSIPKTTTTFFDSAFASFKPAISTRYDATYFYIASTGIPNHNMMIGITNWQQQVPISQPYADANSWSIPLQPVYATTPLSTKTNLMKGAIAVAVNGIPIFNALNNRGEDSYLIGELDNWGGHCGKGDDYHYHAAPMHLSTINGLKPIAFALDGFAVYGAKEPDGTNMASLDTCHGHVGTSGVYHYHGTKDYPYVVGAMKGKVTLDPSMPAPENQILPQAFTKPARPSTNPLKGAYITDFAAVGSNGYLLTYKIGTKTAYVKYSWDASNKYTYILTDTLGNAVSTTYQR
jgi:hypothetical protein